MKESISKYNIIGNEYVRLDDLNELIRDMQKKHRASTEPGYMHETEEQRIVADLALGHLHVVLNKERNFDGILCKLMKTRFEREEREEREKREKREEAENNCAAMEGSTDDMVREIIEGDEEEGSFIVYKRGDKPREVWQFVEWRNKKPVIGRCDGMVFKFKGMAEYVAEQLGDGWGVMDVSPEAMERDRRLFRAIFRKD